MLISLIIRRGLKFHSSYMVRYMQLYFARMCTHESFPPGRSGGEHATHHEPDLCGDCAFFDACMRHIKMLCFWYSNIYACITHVHTYVCGTYVHAMVVFGHSPSLGYQQWPIYSWARVDVHHFDQQRERGYQGGFFFSWFALPYSHTSIMVRFET